MTLLHDAGRVAVLGRMIAVDPRKDSSAKKSSVAGLDSNVTPELNFTEPPGFRGGPLV